MLDSLTGKLIVKSPTEIVLKVGGVGFSVAVPLGVYERLGEPGSEVRLLTHLYVREDQLKLFGFDREADRALFRRLITISGVGPSLALAVLSRFSLADLAEIVASGDAKRLSTVKRLGMKTAAKVLIELKGKLDLDFLIGDVKRPTGVASEAISALEALGFSLAQAEEAVRKTLKKLGSDSGVEVVIKESLKQ